MCGNFLVFKNLQGFWWLGSFICVNREWSLTCNENYLSTTLRTYNFPSLFLQKICISTDSSFQLTNVLRNYSDVKAQIFYFLWYWDRERRFPKRIYFDKKIWMYSWPSFWNKYLAVRKSYLYYFTFHLK